MSKGGYYLIGFIGTNDFRRVSAHSVKEAKTLFAQYHHIQVSAQIVAHKWTVEYLNNDSKDTRMTIDWLKAEYGYPNAESKDQWRSALKEVPA